MAVKAFPLSGLNNKIKNVYEAVMISARRARQINEEQMIVIRNILGPEENDSEEIRPIEREEYKDIEKLAKPVALALKELTDNQIEYDYINSNRE